MTSTLRSGENHCSDTITMGCSLPIVPAAIVVVVRVPVASDAFDHLLPEIFLVDTFPPPAGESARAPRCAGARPPRPGRAPAGCSDGDRLALIPTATAAGRGHGRLCFDFAPADRFGSGSAQPSLRVPALRRPASQSRYRCFRAETLRGSNRQWRRHDRRRCDARLGGGIQHVHRSGDRIADADALHLAVARQLLAPRPAFAVAIDPASSSCARYDCRRSAPAPFR